MIHILLHLAVPAVVAAAFYRPRVLPVLSILLATMIVDTDHLLATPIYDPVRCSIGFHPLHTLPAIGIYVGLFSLPVVVSRESRIRPMARILHVVGLGLVIHMALDLGDCFL